MLPNAESVDPEIKTAILDGGLPLDHCINRWGSQYDLSDIHANDVPEYNMHGLAVSSAFLFGPLFEGSDNKQPYSYITMYEYLILQRIWRIR